MNLSTFAAELKIRFDRGNAWVSWLKSIIVSIAAIKVLFPALPFYFFVVFGFIIALVLILLGHIDLQYAKVFQKELALITGKYNLHLKRFVRARA